MATEAKGMRVNLDGEITDVMYKDEAAREQLANIGKTVYPVGSIYISVTDTSPASLFGGTWEQLKDRFLLAAGDSYAAGSTGGEATHTLTASEMPSHNHVYSNATGVQGHQLTVNEMPSHTHNYPNTPLVHVSYNVQGYVVNGGTNQRWIGADGSNGGNHTAASGGNGGHSHGLSKANANTTNTGSGAAHNNMPPYLAVYAWKRVA